MTRPRGASRFVFGAAAAPRRPAAPVPAFLSALALTSAFALTFALALASGLAVASTSTSPTLAAAPLPAERFRAASALARAGDYPAAIAIYRELAAAGIESPSLYWNWAQAARARGATGEALWALLRLRELDPAERALPREIEGLREAANLDPAELTPEPLQAVARFARRFRLDLGALGLLVLSLAAHGAARVMPLARWPVPLGWGSLAAGVLLALVPLLGAAARPTAVVVARGAVLLDAASPSATALGTLREGEVVPVLERGGDYLRIEDSAGGRGWAHTDDVWLTRSLHEPEGRLPAP